MKAPIYEGTSFYLAMLARYFVSVNNANLLSKRKVPVELILLNCVLFCGLHPETVSHMWSI